MRNALPALAAVMCVVLLPASSVGQLKADLLIKHGGGQVYSGSQVIGGRTDLREPLDILEQRGDWLLVQMRSGKKGWVRRAEVGTFDEVLADVSEKIEARARDVSARIFRAELLARREALGDVEQALLDLTEAARVEPGNFRIYELRGPLWMKDQKWDSAIQDFDRLLALKPDFYWALLKRAVARIAQREFAAAIADLDRYIAFQPRDSQGYCVRASAFVETQQYDRAETDFVKALTLDDKSPLPCFERARMWMRRHEAPRAVADLEETLRRAPEHADAALFLATLLACGPDDTPRNGKRAVELALALCERTQWTDYRAVEALAAAYGECGEFAKAVQTQEKALALLDERGIVEGPKLQAQQRLAQYKADRPVRLVR